MRFCEECTLVVLVEPPVVQHTSHRGQQQHEHVLEDVVSYACDKGKKRGLT